MIDETQIGPAMGIRTRGLCKSFGDTVAVRDLEFEAARGKVTALLGPSGCGKTTTLRMIAGLERPDAGEIELGGRIVSGPGSFVPPERRRVGLVFQDYALFPNRDVAGNVEFALGPDAPEGRTADLLDLVGLKEVARRHPHELSGGQQQRVALARALAADPSAILLDEPFSNLDASLRDRVRREVRQILSDAEATAVFVTHDQEEALSIADTVAVMRDGAAEQVGAPEEIYTRPASRWVAKFLGDAEVLPATASGDSAHCELGSFPAHPELHGPAEIIVRPESIAMGIGSAPGNVTVRKATVRDHDFYGHDQLLHLELESGRRIRCRRPGFPAWHAGDRVLVWIDGPVTVLPADPPQ